jgi:hypothetical protein
MTNPQFVTSSSRLTKQNSRTLWLVALGGALESYDFVIFVFFANTIGDLFFPPGIPDWLRQFQTFDTIDALRWTGPGRDFEDCCRRLQSLDLFARAVTSKQ